MNKQTRVSLLLRVRDSSDEQAWREFYELYAPLLYAYARAHGLKHEDAEDIRAICCETLVKSMKNFDYEKSKGGFKAWLRTMVHRRVVDRLRKRRERPAQIEELRALPAETPSAEQLWEEAWTKRHLAYCVERVRQRVAVRTFELFDLLTREQLSVAEICAQKQVSANQVYKAKARMIEMIRQEMRLLDPDAEL